MSMFISCSSCLNQVISYVVYASALYSASVDDLATVCCFLVCQDTKLSLKIWKIRLSIVELMDMTPSHSPRKP